MVHPKEVGRGWFIVHPLFSSGTMNIAPVPLLVAIVAGVLGSIIVLVVFALVALVVCYSVYIKRRTKCKSCSEVTNSSFHCALLSFVQYVLLLTLSCSPIL